VYQLVLREQAINIPVSVELIIVREHISIQIVIADGTFIDRLEDCGVVGGLVEGFV
jgi:hypothetical protein